MPGTPELETTVQRTRASGLKRGAGRDQDAGRMSATTAEENDPRVFFAAERTLLAWIRTGLTVIGLGFVIARFGLFLRIAAREGVVHEPTTSSTLLGVSFVVLGSTAIAMGVLQFARFVQRLPDSAVPQHYARSWPVWFAWLLTATGLVLAAYLVVRSQLV
jgi:putative membrane protein